MGIHDRDYMKRRPPDYDQEDGDDNYSREEQDDRNARLNKRVTLIFGYVIFGVILITIIALAFSE